MILTGKNDPATAGNSTLLTFSLLLSLLIIGGCDDDPVSDATGDAPEIPDFSQAAIDASYFQDNASSSSLESTGQLQDGHEGAPFQVASSLVSSIQIMTEGVRSMPGFYTLEHVDATPQQSNNTWIWSYSDELPFGDGMSITYSATITAEVNEAANTADWTNEVSWEEPGGGSIDEFLVLEGTAALDHTAGDWAMYSPEEPGMPALEFEYEVQEEDTRNLHYTFHESEEVTQDLMEFIYEQNAEEHLLQLITTAEGATEVIEIFWNTGTGTGYIDSPDFPHCNWDADGMLTECEDGEMNFQYEEGQLLDELIRAAK